MLTVRHSLLFCACLIAGCAGTSDLTVAPAARAPDGAPPTGVDRHDGVSVAIRPDAWSGIPLDGDARPIRVRIENTGGRTLRLRYDAFALVTADGRRLGAMPPFDIDGKAVERRGNLTPGFTHRGFLIAPYHAGYFPGIAPYRFGFHAAPFVYDHYHGYWDRIDLPTERMLEAAIPEGALEPGGVVHGFVYFEPATLASGPVDFRFDLVDEQSGQHFGELRIPLLPESEAAEHAQGRPVVGVALR